ncbi:hypothetical protein C7M84_006186 [Penaeus vannamei]|uniref:Uncharacterized protein n=1 Tax=Penaeus vannamei TaxID=6689 RepID=A0A3R7M7W0_PENVA|nr:hypothetical protein C7M84_006186 [Penaeus vannamei]
MCPRLFPPFGPRRFVSLVFRMRGACFLMLRARPCPGSGLRCAPRACGVSEFGSVRSLSYASLFRLPCRGLPSLSLASGAFGASRASLRVLSAGVILRRGSPLVSVVPRRGLSRRARRLPGASSTPQHHKPARPFCRQVRARASSSGSRGLVARWRYRYWSRPGLLFAARRSELGPRRALLPISICFPFSVAAACVSLCFRLAGVLSAVVYCARARVRAVRSLFGLGLSSGTAAGTPAVPLFCSFTLIPLSSFSFWLARPLFPPSFLRALDFYFSPPHSLLPALSSGLPSRVASASRSHFSRALATFLSPPCCPPLPSSSWPPALVVASASPSPLVFSSDPPSLPLVLSAPALCSFSIHAAPSCVVRSRLSSATRRWSAFPLSHPDVLSAPLIVVFVVLVFVAAAFGGASRSPLYAPSVVRLPSPLRALDCLGAAPSSLVVVRLPHRVTLPLLLLCVHAFQPPCWSESPAVGPPLSSFPPPSWCRLTPLSSRRFGPAPFYPCGVLCPVTSPRAMVVVSARSVFPVSVVGWGGRCLRGAALTCSSPFGPPDVGPLCALSFGFAALVRAPGLLGPPRPRVPAFVARRLPVRSFSSPPRPLFCWFVMDLTYYNALVFFLVLCRLTSPLALLFPCFLFPRRSLVCGLPFSAFLASGRFRPLCSGARMSSPAAFLLRCRLASFPPGAAERALWPVWLPRRVPP